MAIYKNREVTVVGPNPQANTPTSINIQYQDGSHENVGLSQVKFTEDEKKALIKNHPSKFDNVDTVKDEDLKAVRVGVAPTYDTSAKEAAETEAFRKKQLEVGKEQHEKLKADAEKNVDKKVNAPVAKPVLPVQK